MPQTLSAARPKSKFIDHKISDGKWRREIVPASTVVLTRDMATHAVRKQLRLCNADCNCLS